ncbi:TraB/GumN family protein [Comamonas composti]|uniref:TraB/GumN family protein n=1 Tax=Comamonas composti TaxID=408558 RepID=UPI00041E2A35|nr:TraB/GumN family protein [Comamonas composti]
MRGLKAWIARGLLTTLACMPGLALSDQEPQAPEPQVCPPVARMPGKQEFARIASRARDRGLLWRIEHQGRSSWLYGTLHVGYMDWMAPGPTVLSALKAADSLALELDILDPAVLQALQQGLSALPEARPLPPSLESRLQAQVGQACLGEQLQSLRPDARVMSLIAQSARAQGLDVAYGIDLSLAGIAKAMGKPLLGLETPQRQLRELVSDDPERMQESVSTALDQLESGSAASKLQTLSRIWADGRLHLLESLPQWCDCLNTPAEREAFARLVDGRNPEMAQAIARQLKAGRSVFAAVGALHMVGPKGLPALLKAQGFKVERVEFKERVYDLLGAAPVSLRDGIRGATPQQ